MINLELDSDVAQAQGQHRVRSRRSTMEIKMDILTVVMEGAVGPTQIMYKANLSWNLLSQHLKDLVEHGVLLENNVKTRSTYQLTERGISILRSYRLVVEEVKAADQSGMHAFQ